MRVGFLLEGDDEWRILSETKYFKELATHLKKTRGKEPKPLDFTRKPKGQAQHLQLGKVRALLEGRLPVLIKKRGWSRKTIQSHRNDNEVSQGREWPKTLIYVLTDHDKFVNLASRYLSHVKAFPVKKVREDIVRCQKNKQKVCSFEVRIHNISFWFVTAVPNLNSLITRGSRTPQWLVEEYSNILASIEVVHFI